MSGSKEEKAILTSGVLQCPTHVRPLGETWRSVICKLTCMMECIRNFLQLRTHQMAERERERESVQEQARRGVAEKERKERKLEIISKENSTGSSWKNQKV